MKDENEFRLHPSDFILAFQPPPVNSEVSRTTGEAIRQV
jgi:hypothetical protein